MHNNYLQKGQELNMNKEYTTPDFDITIFEIESILTSSSGGGGWEEDDNG